MKKIFTLLFTHLLIGVIGFMIGIYTLPILTAPKSPSSEVVLAQLGKPEFMGKFQRDLRGSDFLHWGEGTVYISSDSISLMGEVAPGPDYKLYLSPEFVETEEEFKKLKSQMMRVGDVKTFNNFIVPVSNSIEPSNYNTVVIWCESFNEFITAAKYK